jgi:hypothetical protein
LLSLLSPPFFSSLWLSEVVPLAPVAVGGCPGDVWFRFHGMSLPFVACYHRLIGISIDLGWFGGGGEFGFGLDSIRGGPIFLEHVRENIYFWVE